MELRNKIVVITGASSGLGKELARAFRDAGASVVASSQNRAELQRAAKELAVTHFMADVTSENDVKRLAGFAVKKFGRINVWVNNAGITMPHSDIEEIDAKRAHRLMEVNFFGTFYGSRAALHEMKKRGGGAILNILSVSALTGRPQSAAYSGSKWAARGFTEALKLAVGPKKILVVGVYPGGIKTGF
jgi:NAD(P)-dependent dehydrogenase (short-subunit alcohol dehydrogenase family)